jgi:RNA polymerase sigma-54 factor
VDETHYVVPDVICRKVKGMWIASLNRRRCPSCASTAFTQTSWTRHREQGGNQLTSQLQEARWLIKNVQQRFDTILRVSQAIVDRQRHFFEHGEVAMRPLVLREIADALELHESTISRVTTQKFMMTPRGLYELKYFFGSHVATDTGGACLLHRDPRPDQAAGCRGNVKKPLSDGATGRGPRPAGHRRRAPHRRQVPGIFADPAGQPEEEPVGSPMNLNLSGHHVDITPALRSYVQGKLARVTAISTT